jgi:hypothetical protein
METSVESETEADKILPANESSSTQSPPERPSSSESYGFENTTANISQSEQGENEEDPGNVMYRESM